MGYQEKIIEGKYNFFNNNQKYCEEFFKLYQDSGTQANYTFNSEILSRVETGEFLKIYVDYELSYQFEPINLRIKRSLGAKKSTERYAINAKDKTVQYQFSSKFGSGDDERPVNGKFHLANPSFASSFAMTHHKKPDPVHRTPYLTLSSPNIWKYESSFRESMMHVEVVNSEPKTIKLRDGREVQAVHFKVFDEDKLSNPHGNGQDFFISKHFQIPYKAEFNNGLQVEIETMKNLKVDHSSLFKN
jgi:hypothetical protein